eukprot:360365-Chlamydomonas_euryale.AAC.1
MVVRAASGSRGHRCPMRGGSCPRHTWQAKSRAVASLIHAPVTDMATMALRLTCDPQGRLGHGASLELATYRVPEASSHASASHVT